MKSIFTLLVFTFFFAYQSSAQLRASRDTAICAGQPVQLSATGGSTYSWTPAGSLSNASIANPVATPTQTTTYVVSSQLPNTNLAPNPDFSQGNTGFTSSYTYEVPTNLVGSGSYFVGGNANHWNPGMSVLCSDHTSGADTLMLIANAALTANTPVWCVTLPVSPNCSYSLGAYFEYFNQTNIPSMRWMVNGTPIGNATAAPLFQCLWASVSATWNSGSDTSATFCLFDPLTAGNGNDFAIDDISIVGSGTAYDTVTVTVLPSPSVSLGSDTTLCRNSTIHLSTPFNGTYSYLWNNGSTLNSLDVTTAGTYSLTVSSGNGCSSSDAVIVAASTLADPVISANDTLICANDSAQLCVVSAQGSYVWNTNVSTSCIYASNAGNYWLVVTGSDHCTASSNRIGLSVYPVPPVSISVNGDTLVGYNAAAYQWLRNGNVIPGANDSVYIATQSGVYTLQVTDGNGCKALSSPVNIATGIEEAARELISIYPNPSAGNWQLNIGQELIGAMAEITDVTGKTISKFEIRNPKSEFSSPDISSGIYWLRVIAKNKNYAVKLIKL